MTVTTYDPNAWGDDIGLEDVEASDVAVPRLRINHVEGKFKDPLSGAEYPTLKVILLGLVKQRIFWRGDIDEGDRPACKSPDFEHGFPNLDERTPQSKRFPIAQSNFNLADFPPSEAMNGHVALPCASCVFAQWGKEDGKPVPPPCAEQHTYPLLYQTEDGAWIPAILTFQKTGIKPSRSYISSFAQTKTPMFTVETELALDTFKRGQVVYSVPKFRKGAATDQENWGEYANRYRGLRDFIRSIPRAGDDAESEGAPAAKAPADDPWAKDNGTAPAATSAPVAAPTPAPAPATPAPSPSPATAQGTPVAATPAPVDTPATATPPPADDDDDDLPF